MSIETLTKKLESGELDDSIREFVLEEAKKRQKHKDFIHTDKFKTDFQILKKYLQEHKAFSTDGIYYTETKEEKIFSEAAIQIFTTVDYNTGLTDVEDATFPTSETSYDGVKMSVMIGQGSVLRFWI